MLLPTVHAYDGEIKSPRIGGLNLYDPWVAAAAAMVLPEATVGELLVSPYLHKPKPWGGVRFS